MESETRKAELEAISRVEYEQRKRDAKASIMAIPNEAERLKAIEENMILFKDDVE